MLHILYIVSCIVLTLVPELGHVHGQLIPYSQLFSPDVGLPKDPISPRTPYSGLQPEEQVAMEGEYSLHYDTLKPIGKGAFGFVRQAERKDDGTVVRENIARVCVCVCVCVCMYVHVCLCLCVCVCTCVCVMCVHVQVVGACTHDLNYYRRDWLIGACAYRLQQQENMCLLYVCAYYRLLVCAY